MHQNLASFFITRNDLGHFSLIGTHFLKLKTDRIWPAGEGKIAPYQNYRYDGGHIILYLNTLFCKFNSLKHDHYDHKESR
jgi:hypothetical protein